MTATQPTDLRNQGRYFAETHENVFDRLTMLIQQGFSGLSRALKRPIGKNYYDAEGRQIKNMADPTDNQDAVNKQWAQQYVGDVVGGIQGPINNSANVLYLYPDGTPHVVQDLSTTDGAKGIGWLGTSLAETLYRIPIYISSYGFPTGGNDRPGLQALIDSLIPIAYNTELIFDNDADLLVDNQLLVRASGLKVRRTGRGFIKLTQSTTQGHILAVFDGATTGTIIEDVILENMGVDGDNWGYPRDASAGENGIAGTRCRRIQVIGGHVKNCRDGKTQSYGTGGKGLQFEMGVADIFVSGVLIEDCSIAMETGGVINGAPPNDFRTFTGVRYTNIVARRCERLISVNQPFTPFSTDVRVCSAVFDGITAYNCGYGVKPGKELAFGAIIMDRASNVTIKNVVIENDGTYGTIAAVIRFSRGENNDIDVTFKGNCLALVSHVRPDDAGGYILSGQLRRNRFKVASVSGSAENLIKIVQADITGTLTNNTYDLGSLAPSGALVSLDSGALPITNYATFRDLSLAKTIQGNIERIRVAVNSFPTESTTITGPERVNGIIFTFGAGSESIYADAGATLNIGVNSVPRIQMTSTQTRIEAGDYANDAAAAAAGVPIGWAYWNSSSGVLTKRKV